MSEMRHGTTEELLALRDGEGSAWARNHVAACAACAADLYRLEQMRAQLRALPVFVPPRDRWPVIAHAARRERRRRWQSGAMGLAAAASLVGLLVVATHGTRPDRSEAESALKTAMAQSAAMERALQVLAPETRALSGARAGVVADLEDRLVRIDAALGDPSAWRWDPDQVIQLWRQRTGLLSALVDVHSARVAVAGL